MLLGGAAALALLLFQTHPAAARDKLSDCQTYGPHSDSCTRAIEKQDDPQAQADRLDRERQRRINQGLPPGRADGRR